MAINTTPEQDKAAQELVNRFINSTEEETIMVDNTVNNTTINNNTKSNFKEVIDMTATTLNNKVEEVKQNAKALKEEATQDYVDRADSSVNELKDMLIGTVKYIGDVLGLSSIYDELVDIYAENRSLIKTAKTVDKAIKRSIAIMKSIDPDDKLGKIAALKQVVYDGDYEEEYRQSIFMSIAKAITWIGKKVARKLRKWFGVEAEENIFGEVGAKISSCFKSISNFVINVGKATGSLLLYAGSFVVAGAIKVGCLVIRAIKGALTKLKEWGSIALKKIRHEDEDDFDDEDIFEDDDYDFDKMVEDANN